MSAATVDEGPVLKRWRARARGRAGRIRKRTCHITVLLAPIPGESAPEVRKAEAAPAQEKPKRTRAPRKKKTEEA